MKSKDSKGNDVFIGDFIKVLEVDPRITEFLPEDEKEDLLTFVGNVFRVESINSDGSMVVTQSWSMDDEIYGHDLAIFPKGSLLERRG